MYSAIDSSSSAAWCYLIANRLPGEERNGVERIVVEDRALVGLGEKIVFGDHRDEVVARLAGLGALCAARARGFGAKEHALGRLLLDHRAEHVALEHARIEPQILRQVAVA